MMDKQMDILQSVADGKPTVFDEPEAKDVVSYVESLEAKLEKVRELRKDMREGGGYCYHDCAIDYGERLDDILEEE